MGSSDITQQTFTRFYFDTEKTKKVIEWLIDEWGHELTPHADKVEDIALISSSFRRLCRLILTTRGLTCLGILGKEETLDNFFSEEEKIKSFRKNLETKLFTEKRFTLNDKLKEFFLESIVDYAKFQQPNEKFAEVTKKKKTGSIFQWISSPKYPAYIRIDLLTELAFRKLRKASDDQLFRSSKIRIELQEMIKYGEKIIKKIESDSQILIGTKNNQLFGNPSSTAALFHLRKTLIKVRYNPSPMDIFESALETLNMYKYPNDELRSIYGQIWTYHVIMRVHMFRGDQIQVELYEKLIDGMVEGLTNNKYSKYRTLGKYLDVWGLTSHKKKGREYKEAVELRLMQKEFFNPILVRLINQDMEEQNAEILAEDRTLPQIKKLKQSDIESILKINGDDAKKIMEKIKNTVSPSPRKKPEEKSPYHRKPAKWEKVDVKEDDYYSPYNLFRYIAHEEENIDNEIEKALKEIDNKHEDDIKGLKKTDTEKLKTLTNNRKIKPLEIKRDRWKKSSHCKISTKGASMIIFGPRKQLQPHVKRELIKKIPEKFEECIDQLLTSKSPLRIAFLRIITREYLLQFTKYACSPIKNEPNYSDDSIDIVKSFVNGPCKDFKDNLERLSEEFNLMGENIARDEIEEYVKVFEVIRDEDFGQKLDGKKIRDKGIMIQKILKQYILEKRPNSKLYFPRKYPRITKL